MSSGKELTQKNNSPRKPIRHHKPDVKKLDDHLLKIFNEKDATVLPGITDYNWMQLLSEVGTGLQKWKTDKHFTSWLGLAPKQHNSGKMRRNYRSKGWVKQTAVSLINSKEYRFRGVWHKNTRISCHKSSG